MVQFGIGSRIAALVAASLMAGMSASAVAKTADSQGAESAAREGDKSATPARKVQPTRYCVMVRPATGTIFSGRVCMTREQWLREGFDPTAPQE